MNRAQIADLQRDLNDFFSEWVAGPQQTRVDGRNGTITRRRVRQAKFYLGYEEKGIDHGVDHRFRVRLRHPRATRFSSPDMRRRGALRRARHEKAWKRHKKVADMHPGITNRNGVPVAKWLAVVYDWAKRNGWPGLLNSGYRTIAYSIGLCIRMCGHVFCPGRCAGANTNHRFFVKPGGAMDVGFYWIFGRLMWRCPIKPRIFNALGARDPVHFSASGR